MPGTTSRLPRRIARPAGPHGPCGPTECRGQRHTVARESGLSGGPAIAWQAIDSRSELQSQHHRTQDPSYAGLIPSRPRGECRVTARPLVGPCAGVLQRRRGKVTVQRSNRQSALVESGSLLVWTTHSVYTNRQGTPHRNVRSAHGVGHIVHRRTSRNRLGGRSLVHRRIHAAVANRRHRDRAGCQHGAARIVGADVAHRHCVRDLDRHRRGRHRNPRVVVVSGTGDSATAALHRSDTCRRRGTEVRHAVTDCRMKRSLSK